MNRIYLRHGGPGPAALLLIGIVCIALPVALQAQPLPGAGAGEMAAATVYSGGVDFQPSVGYSRAILTVSGNDRLFRREVPAAARLSIGVFDPDGQLLADGTYRWQLELVPTEKEAERLRAEAAANGGRPLSPWRAQSGVFTVRGGAIADPALAEARTETPAGPAASSLSFDRVVAARASVADDDAAVGSRQGVEAEVAAAAARRAPAAAAGALLQASPMAGDDADTTAMALGRSLERAGAAPDTQLSASPPARPRSDGSNGRPRS